MSMNDAKIFWRHILHQSKLDQSLSLPFDRHRLENQHRTGRGTNIYFQFGEEISHHFLVYAQVHRSDSRISSDLTESQSKFNAI
jgi:hypothetical protein